MYLYNDTCVCALYIDVRGIRRERGGGRRDGIGGKIGEGGGGWGVEYCT